MATFVNLTPHALTIHGEGCTLSLPASGTVARCATVSERVATLNGIPLARTTYGEVVGLPEPSDDTIYIVSALVRAAVPTREDVASPGELVRGADGQPTGCRGLVVN
jgi:hypothetical protein